MNLLILQSVLSPTRGLEGALGPSAVAQERGKGRAVWSETGRGVKGPYSVPSLISD